MVTNIIIPKILCEVVVIYLWNGSSYVQENIQTPVRKCNNMCGTCDEAGKVDTCESSARIGFRFRLMATKIHIIYLLLFLIWAQSMIQLGRYFSEICTVGGATGWYKVEIPYY